MPDLSPLFSWRSAVTESDLHPTARLVALVLSLHMNERGGSSFPSHATLARETGLHPETVKDRLTELRDLGWLEAEFRRGKTTRYTATTPDGLSTTKGSTTGGSRTPGGPRPLRGGVHDPLGKGSTTPPRSLGGRQEDDNPPNPPAGGAPNPSCPWCYGTGWMDNDDGTAVNPCGCTKRAPRNRKPR